jgi:O-antigen/teichoic acid export membrane protein
MDLTGVVSIAGNLGRLGLVPWAMSGGNPLLNLALVVAVTGAAEAIAVAILAMKLDPALRIRLVIPKRAEISELYGFGLFAFFLQVADKVISYTDVLVIGLVLGPIQVGIYSVPLQLNEYGRMIGRGFVSVLLPHLAVLHARGGVTELARAYIRTVRTSTLIAVLVMVNLVLVGPRFLVLWVGPDYSGRPVLLWLSVAGIVQALAVQGQLQFCHALGRNRLPAILMVCEGAVNLALSVVLARMVGTSGVAFASAAAAVLISGIGLPIYVGRLLQMPMRNLLNRAVVPALILSVVAVVAQMLFDALMKESSYRMFCVNVLYAVCVGVTAAWFLATHTERRILKAAIGRFRARYFQKTKASALY